MAGALDGLQTASHIRQIRQQYDAAFRKLASLRRERSGSEQLQELETEVRYHRDRLADALLQSHQPMIDDTSRTQEAAYFIWHNAGRPHGTWLCDWMDARKQIQA